ncbi:MAG TPA: ABC transporter ATP-binding protein [Pseudolabrys sp.]|jgi:ATP-binding cassette, subfamily B, bacterial MsbA|nr:ABC transporter ATP-binding protein [Pseudolabrys sp.]
MTKHIMPDSADARYGSLAMIKRLLLEQGLARWPQYAFAFTLMAVAAACTALPAYLISDFVNTAYLDRSFDTVMMLGAATMIIFVVKGLADYGHMTILARIGNSVVAENQRRLFDKLLTERISFFAERHSSEFAARLQAGATSANQVLNQIVTAFGRDFLTVVGLVIVMFVRDPKMALICFVVFPPAMLLLRKMIRRIRSIAKAQFHGGTRILETMQEMIQGIAVVKAFTLEEQMHARFDANVREVERESNKMARVAARASPIMETLGGVAVSIGVVYGGYRTIVLGATPGELISFITAFLLANQPAKRLARLNIELNSALVNVRALFDVLDAPATEPREDEKPALAVERAAIEYRDIHFAYRAGEPVLRGLSLTAEPGKVTALVGPSGGGKSTVLNLLLRFYESDRGAITIDGQDIKVVSRRSLRQAIGYVGQHVFLFRGTIRDNIAFGRPDATEAEIVAAAKAAFAHDFIMASPRGYDTPVGEHGLQLSGGQRQRIAIARALIKDAPIILLDEATAALDSESERQVQEALDRLTQGRTTIVIAHRLHTITHADRIHVVEDGVVVESGVHDDLLRRDGRYASFYRMQFKNQDVAEQVIAMASVK